MPLFDSNEELHVAFSETDITSSTSNKRALLVAGVTPTNTASFLKMEEDGSVKISGFFSASLTPSGTQQITGSVTVNSIVSPITANQGTSGSFFWKITGSVGITETVPLTIGSFSANVTASVKIVAVEVTQSITGTVGITSIASPVNIGNFPAVQTITGSVVLGEQPIQTTGSFTVNNFPVTQSVYIGQISPGAIQNITGVVGVTSIASPIRQGASGTISNSWYVTPTNGTGVIGNTQATPIWISGSTFIFNNPATPTWITGSATISSVAAPVTVAQGASGSLPWKTDQDELPTFIVGVSGSQIGNNKNMLSILNAQGSSVIIRLKKIQIMNVQTSNITGITAIFSFLKVKDHSGGTIVDAVAHDSSYTTSSFVSTRTNSTITGSVQSFFRILKATDERNTAGSLDPETFEYVFSQTFGDYSLPWKTRPITLHAGEGFAIRQTANSTAGTFDIYFMFTQEGT